MQLCEKSPDEIFDEISKPSFSLVHVLNDRKMSEQFEFISTMIQIFGKLVCSEKKRDDIVKILREISNTKFIVGVNKLVGEKDPNTNELYYDIIQSFLRLANTYMSMLPSTANDIVETVEKIEYRLTKNQSDSKVCIHSID